MAFLARAVFGLFLYMKVTTICHILTFSLGFVAGYYSHVLRVKYLQAKHQYFDRKAREARDKLQKL